jgi:hypothetical protein
MSVGAQTTGMKRKLADWAKSISPKGKLKYNSGTYA